MPASLTWLDHDTVARERSLRILALFQEKESRDELGLSGIRDTFSDQLFPGTSTIQTRLRYMLFVPWIYQKLEEGSVPSSEFAQRAAAAEHRLIDTMRRANVPEAGVFGRRAGGSLKRLPSSVYWGGLGAWGIRRADLSQERYHHHIEVIYTRRKEQMGRHRERGEIGDDPERVPGPGTIIWHPRLPKPPKGFPEGAGFQLTGEEAGFLLDQIHGSHPSSLLAHLFRHCPPARSAYPWEHPDRAEFSPQHVELLEHARVFSSVMHCAALLYNIALAEHAGRTERQEVHEQSLQAWFVDQDMAEVRGWSLDRLWSLTEGHGHTITLATRRFVEEWVAELRAHGTVIGDSASARELIRRRETTLKKGQSRFVNRRALDQWSGSSGLGRMAYRWATVSDFHEDLHAGLHKDGEH